MYKTKVTAERKFSVEQHVGHEKHIQAMQLAGNKKSKQLLLQKTAFKKDNKSSVFTNTFVNSIFCKHTVSDTEKY